MSDLLSRINEGANRVRIDKFTAIFAKNTYASLQIFESDEVQKSRFEVLSVRMWESVVLIIA